MPDVWSSPTSYAVNAEGSGELTVEFETAAGSYDVLLGGDIYGRAEIAIDGRVGGSERGGLYATGDYKRVGTIDLEAGRHELEARLPGREPASGKRRAGAPDRTPVARPRSPRAT